MMWERMMGLLKAGERHSSHTEEHGILMRQITAIRTWLTGSKGVSVHPKWGALKALEEMVELCIASGADGVDISHVVNSEMQKGYVRAQVDGQYDPSEAKGELGDAFVCLVAYALRQQMSIPEVIDMCLARIERRQWAPDENGILRRPR